MNKIILYKLKRFIVNFFNFFVELFSKKNVGKDVIFGFNVQILGWRNIKIGNNTIIGDNSWLNVNHRNNDINIEIGNNCYFGKHNVINTGKKVIIKDFFMSSVNVNILGGNHIFSNPFIPYIYSGATKDAITYIGSNVWIGANSSVLGNVTIGHGSIIGAGSIVTKDIPPFSIAVGNPAKVIKRYSFEKKSWQNIAEYDNKEIFPDEKEYLEKISKYNIKLPPQIAGKIAGDI